MTGFGADLEAEELAGDRDGLVQALAAREVRRGKPFRTGARKARLERDELRVVPREGDGGVGSGKFAFEFQQFHGQGLHSNSVLPSRRMRRSASIRTIVAVPICAPSASRSPVRSTTQG